MAITLEEALMQLREALAHIRHLEAENLGLVKKIAELERRLAAYENANTPPSKVRFKPKREEGSGQVGRPPGAEGSTRPVPEPEETIDVTASVCPSCKKPLGKPSHVERKVIEDIPERRPVRVVEYMIAHYDCACGEHVVARHSDCPKEGRFGPNLQAEVALMVFKERLPVRKVMNSLLRRYGLRLSPATVLNILERVKEKLRSEYEKIKALVRTSPVVNADETTCPVNGVDWWLWLFKTTSEVLLRIDKSRGRGVVEGVLGGKTERLIGTDGHAAYNGFGTWQRCWAHLIRLLKFIVDQQSRFRPFLDELRGFFHQLKEKVALKPPPQEKLRIVADAKRWMEDFLTTAKSHRELKKFVTYAENGMNSWFTFVLHDEIEPTNNAVEQLLREHVVRRKIFGTLRNGKGTEIYQVIGSVISTWELRGLNPNVAMVSALRR